MPQMRQHFGPKFMIAEVPEGPQVPAGMQAYGGQFGSFLPVIYGTRDILSFVECGELQHSAARRFRWELLHAGNARLLCRDDRDDASRVSCRAVRSRFSRLCRQKKWPSGFLAGPSEIPTLENALRYLIQGKPYAGGEYKLQRPSGYLDFNGAMFWNIQSDRRDNYQMSNAVGPFLHSLPLKGTTTKTSTP